jgi:hypothetical protein
VGDFTGRIQTVFVDLAYNDATNSYTQSKSQALTGASQFFDWTFPVVDDDGGQVTYKAIVSYKDGTSDPVPPTVATTDTILLPPITEAFLEVQVVTELVDWTQVRLVRLSLSYADPPNDVAEAEDFIFSPTSKANVAWKVPIRNKQLDEFTYQITYYLATGLQKTVGPATTRDRAVILDPRA